MIKQRTFSRTIRSKTGRAIQIIARMGCKNAYISASVGDEPHTAVRLRRIARALNEAADHMESPEPGKKRKR